MQGHKGVNVVAHLVAGLVLEAHHLVINGGSGAGALALYPPPILGGLMQVGFYHGMGGSCGVCQVACQLWPLNMYLHCNHVPL